MACETACKRLWKAREPCCIGWQDGIILRGEQEALATEERTVLLACFLDEGQECSLALFAEIFGDSRLDWADKGIGIRNWDIVVDEFDEDGRWCGICGKGILFAGRIDEGNRLDDAGKDVADDRSGILLAPNGKILSPLIQVDGCVAVVAA